MFSIEDEFRPSLELPLSLIDDFPNHPFSVCEDEDMKLLVESIKEHGVITPAITGEILHLETVSESTDYDGCESYEWYFTSNGEMAIEFLEYGIMGDVEVCYRTEDVAQPQYSVYIDEELFAVGISGTKCKLPVKENNFSSSEGAANVIFAGYYTPISIESTIEYLAGEDFTIPNRDVYLTSKYITGQKEYLLSYNFNGGSGNSGDYETFVYEGAEVIIPNALANHATNQNYVFSHWTDGEAIFKPGEIYIMPNHNVTITAIWTNTSADEPIRPSTPSRPITPTKPTYTCPYTDISNHWAKDIIKYIDKLNLVDGETETTFAPDKPMTRESFVTAMARLADVERNYVDWAINIGLLKGYGNGEYGLNDTITREQMAVFFLRFLELTNIDYEDCKTIACYNFADDEQIADWAKEAVYEMQALDLIHGKGNDVFDPKGLTTRAEGATVLYNLCKTVLNK